MLQVAWKHGEIIEKQYYLANIWYGISTKVKVFNTTRWKYKTGLFCTWKYVTKTEIIYFLFQVPWWSENGIRHTHFRTDCNYHYHYHIGLKRGQFSSNSSSDNVSCSACGLQSISTACKIVKHTCRGNFSKKFFHNYWIEKLLNGYAQSTKLCQWWISLYICIYSDVPVY